MIVILVGGFTASMPLGRRGENEARQIVFDLSPYIDTYGAGSAQLLHQRKGDATPYLPAQVEQSGDKLLWTLTSDDTAVAGTGRAELRWYVGDTLAKSVTYSTSTARSLGDPGGEPEEIKSALDLLAEAVEELQDDWQNATATAETLAAGSDATVTFSDGAFAFGIPKGDTGSPGAPGADGSDGDNGVTFTPDVSPEGVLSWTNDGGLPNPQSVNIKGPPGSSFAVHICSAQEYDATTRVPTIANPDSSTFYLVSAADGETGNMYLEWIYTNSAWEQIGNVSIDLSGYQVKINASGILKGDGQGGVSAAVAGTDYATPSLGITGTSVGQFVKVKTVDANGKPTAWETEQIKYALTVTALTQDGVTVTGQTVTVRQGGSTGLVYATAAYEGQPVSFAVPTGFAYYVSITSNLEHHFNPTVASGIIVDADVAVTLTYADFSTIQTGPDIKAALDADIDLTDLVGESVTCSKGSGTLTWDVADYDADEKSITLLLHDTLPDNMVFEPAQALAYFENGLAAGNYSFKQGNATYYFTLTSASPAGGQLKANTSTFQTYESQAATATLETGTTSTTEIAGATDLGTTGAGDLNHHDRVNYGSNNFGESGLFQWLNSDAAASTPMPRVCKYSRPYTVSVAGFLNGLDSDFLGCVDDTIWKCSANTAYEAPASMGGISVKGNPYTVTGKFGLASQLEIYGSYDGVAAGDAIFDLYVGAENADRIKYYNASARHWWLRSPFPSYAYLERFVLTSGTVSSDSASSSLGVVPACKIYKSAESAPLGA